MATAPTAAQAKADADALAADAEAKAKAEAEAVEAAAKADALAAAAKAEADAKTEGEGLVAEIEHEWVAVKDFAARHLTQLLTFAKGDTIAHDVGSALAAKGAPVRPVE